MVTKDFCSTVFMTQRSTAIQKRWSERAVELEMADFTLAVGKMVLL